jgi:hypothetical protein
VDGIPRVGLSVKSGDREEKVVDKTLRVTDRAKKVIVRLK